MGFWSKFASVAHAIVPVVLPLIPGVPPIIVPLVTDAIIETENLGGTGPEKKARVLEIVQDGVGTFNAVKGRVLLMPEIVIPAVSQGIDASIAAINVIKTTHQALTSNADRPFQ